MDHGLLEILRYFLLVLLWLFLLYAARMVWVEVRRGKLERAAVTGKDEITSLDHPPPRRPIHVRVIESPDHEGERFSVEEEATIGRSPECTITLPNDEFASAVHARILQLPDGVYLEDLGSTNGTLVNASPISQQTRLRRGDRFTIGHSIFEVRR
jgi:pSer/pThr/pTyr-binding forkhead associated (FHA) protein